MGKGGKVRGHLVYCLRMAGLGSRRKVHGLREVSRNWKQRQRITLRAGDERLSLQRRTEEQIVTISYTTYLSKLQPAVVLEFCYLSFSTTLDSMS